MALAVTFEDVWTDGRRLHAIGKVVASGNYVAGGEVLNIKGAAANSKGQRWMANSHPNIVLIHGMSGFIYEYDLVNRKLKVFTNSAGGVNGALTEHSAAAYVAGVTGDTIRFYAIGKKLV